MTVNIPILDLRRSHKGAAVQGHGQQSSGKARKKTKVSEHPSSRLWV